MKVYELYESGARLSLGTTMLVPLHDSCHLIQVDKGFQTLSKVLITG